MTLATVCHEPGCGRFTERAVAGRCELHAPGHLARDTHRRRGKWQRRIWDSTAWRHIRLAVLRRDGLRCVDCGRHQDELRENELLLADHVDGLLLHPDGRVTTGSGGDPFDPNECETRCSTCSGRKDGAAR